MTGMDKNLSHVERDCSMKICPELKYMSNMFLKKEKGKKIKSVITLAIWPDGHMLALFCSCDEIFNRQVQIHSEH